MKAKTLAQGHLVQRARAAEFGLERSPPVFQFDIETTSSEELEAISSGPPMRKAETQAWSGPITNECVNKTSHTSQRAASLEEGKGQHKGLALQAQRPGRRGMKFL